MRFSDSGQSLPRYHLFLSRAIGFLLCLEFQRIARVVQPHAHDEFIESHDQQSNPSGGDNP